MTTQSTSPRPASRWQFTGYGRPIAGFCQWPAKMVNPSNPDGWYWSRCGASKSSVCPECAELKRGDIAAVGRSGWIDAPTGRGYFVTLTAPGGDVLPWDRERCLHGSAVPCSGAIGCVVEHGAMARWHEGLGQRWSWFVTEVRRLTGLEVQFFKTFEVQKRGALHIHTMLRVEGVITDRRFRAAIKLAASRWGFGKQVDIKTVDLADTETAAKVAGYCAKYASKSSDALVDVHRMDWHTGEFRPVGLRSWSASRSWGDTMKSIKLRRCQWAATSGATAAAGDPLPPGAAVGGALDSNQGIYATGSGADLCSVSVAADLL